MLCVEIRPSEGGDDAVRFASELTDTIVAVARREGVAPVSVKRSDRCSVLRFGDAPGWLPDFIGVHRVQRIPPGETRRHTSTATVAVLDEQSGSDTVLDVADVRVDFYRDSGPGGQHRNTSDTAVRLTHNPSGIVVCSAGSRSQHANRAAAFAELERRLRSRAAADLAGSQRVSRSEQIGNGERPEVSWTWNEQRGQVTHHRSGRRWRWRDLSRGRF